ncbi:MAG: hypothetical protein U0822_11775 [Anaerolineae bacterium]
MVPVNTGKENGHVTTGASGFNRLRRRSEVVIVALVVAGLCVLALGTVRAQAQAPQTAQLSIGSQPDARAYEVSMNRLRDLNEVAAPAVVDVAAARTYEHNMARLRDLNETAAPSVLTQTEWQARAEAAVDHAAQAHQAAIEAASPALAQAVWQARAEVAVEHAAQAHQAALSAAITRSVP